ncbi:Phosphate transport system regulatory protein PhoU [Alkalibacterium sp. AK22]|uniref:phosphate signaling complex protein PhoU n=1 Tax=Alkalibacterium sp. AK22 TaxID=1229520 RepID=UPI00045194B7|nr:phosphate signaling complex protein PhoU [Alkalibacterium sp. AK22]EXJ24455.1 Phosphate transport system regulatory protein PhoU [Alkalibacterium sp. AK22]
MRRVYEEELNKLHSQFFQMGNRVNEAIYKSIKAFVNHDKELAKSVIEEDIKINDMEHQLEQGCIELIALQQPVTADLRKIITVMKASADLERMGDHAVSISKSTIRVKGNKRNKAIEDQISLAGEKIKKMGQDIVDAYIDYDSHKAEQIALRDEEIDTLAMAIKTASIDEMRRDPELVLGATDYILVSTYIERMGDYITNISEWILYFETGEIQELNTHHDYKQLGV